MGKGGGGGQQINTSVNEPPAYAKPFLEFGVSEAKELYDSDAPQYFPGATTVGFSPESEMALDLQRQRALDPMSLTGQTRSVLEQNLTGTNPLLQASFKPVIDTVQSQFAKAGRYGSGANQQALASALAPAALKAQQDALARIPSMGNLDLKQLAQVGGARESQAQAELQDNINRFNFEQTRDQQKLRDYLAAVKGGTLGSQTSRPVFRNTASSVLGGAMGGAQLGSLAGINPLYGAIGGGLLGLF
tara:strand:- start:708 stop:1445 length:738 start_codon:yes stop_codon:yes gene_type:complete